MNQPTLKASFDGREVRVEWGPFSLSPDEARGMAYRLLDAASQADRLPRIHEHHVTLVVECAICVQEARRDGRSLEATCAYCGEVFDAPSDEDPADTLCVSCAEEEQER